MADIKSPRAFTYPNIIVNLRASFIIISVIGGHKKASYCFALIIPLLGATATNVRGKLLQQ
jgi:hypothetical protein